MCQVLRQSVGQEGFREGSITQQQAKTHARSGVHRLERYGGHEVLLSSFSLAKEEGDAAVVVASHGVCGVGAHCVLELEFCSIQWTLSVHSVRTLAGLEHLLGLPAVQLLHVLGLVCLPGLPQAVVLRLHCLEL